MERIVEFEEFLIRENIFSEFVDGLMENKLTLTEWVSKLENPNNYIICAIPILDYYIDAFELLKLSNKWVDYLNGK